MAAQSGNDTVHATLVASTADTVTLTPSLTREVVVSVDIINPNDAATFWVNFRRDGSDPGADPSSGGDGSYRIPPNSVRTLDVAPKGNPIVVRLYSDEGGPYSVEAS